MPAPCCAVSLRAGIRSDRTPRLPLPASCVAEKSQVAQPVTEESRGTAPQEGSLWPAFSVLTPPELRLAVPSQGLWGSLLVPRGKALRLSVTQVEKA